LAAAKSADESHFAEKFPETKDVKATLDKPVSAQFITKEDLSASDLNFASVLQQWAYKDKDGQTVIVTKTSKELYELKSLDTGVVTNVQNVNSLYTSEYMKTDAVTDIQVLPTGVEPPEIPPASAQDITYEIHGDLKEKLDKAPIKSVVYVVMGGVQQTFQKNK
jgi:hypothetical protein